MCLAPDLREQLQASLAGHYTVERELGGGGMSRVFVAYETNLGRRVVVKVLHPQMVAGVNVDRFKREIALAAALQHPCIVGVLTAGEVDGLPYYTMPFVESESLRARLAAGKPFPVQEVVKILREVASALGYAHDHGVVHRDIKPDNVLLSGGFAMVTDFGIAKALHAAKATEGGSTITLFGTSMGTPAYMAPEQAAGEVQLDQRADFYSLGCLAYELLAGETPFHGRTAAKMIAAKMSEAPTSILERRPELPPALARLVMQCLEKEESKRPQTAAEILQVLDALGTPSAGTLDARPAIALATHRTLFRALGIWALMLVAVVIGAYAAVMTIGLPEWTLPGAVVVMLLGLPVILFTSLAHHGARVAGTTAVVTSGGTVVAASAWTQLAVRASRLLSWRRTWLGGGAALSGFALIVAGYMVLRVLGIGSAGSLFAKGLMRTHDRVVLADLQARGSDSTLGMAFTEALRTDLSQSRAIALVPPSAVQSALERMGRKGQPRLDIATAREVALREGASAVVDGDVTSVGTGYLLAVRLVNPATGDALASFRETANNSDEVIAAIGRVSHELRAKIGESLKSVHDAPPLERVSTVSLDALRKYTAGTRAFDVDRDYRAAAALFRQAIELDSTFAMAHRKLAASYYAYGGQDADAARATERAYKLRDHLPPLERHLVAASYHSLAGDRAGAIAENEAVLATDSLNDIALNNLGFDYGVDRQHARARDMWARILRLVDSTDVTAHGGLAIEQFALGDTAGSLATIRALERQQPGLVESATFRYDYDFSLGHFERAEDGLRQLRAKRRTDAPAVMWLESMEEYLALTRGRLRAADLAEGAWTPASVALGNRLAPYDSMIFAANVLQSMLGRDEEAVRLIDRLARRYDAAKVPSIERRQTDCASIYARAGQSAKARALIAERVRAVPREERGRMDDTLYTRGWIALAEGHPDSAILFFRAHNAAACDLCSLPELARAFDVAGLPDSALGTLERFLAGRDMGRWMYDWAALAPTYQRLGELYDARGDADRALSYYSKFTALWANADPELQPQVTKAKRRMAQLAARKG